MATVTVALEKVIHMGNRKHVIGTITLAGTYTTGGETVTPAALGLELELTDLELGPAQVTGGVLGTSWDKANNKVLLNGAVDASPAVNELSPQLGAVAIPGGPASIRFAAKGLGSAAA